MRAVLKYCEEGHRRELPEGTVIIHEGSSTGHLFVLIEGQLEVVKGDTVVASLTEAGAIVGEMSCLLQLPHTATVRVAKISSVYEINDAAEFLRMQPAVAFYIAKMLAQRLNVATSYLADIKRQYEGHGSHLSMVSEVLASMVNLPPSEASPGSDLRSDPRV